MFLGDNWIGTEPFGKYFKDIELDAVVGSVIQKNPDVLSLIKEKLSKFLIDVQKDRLDKSVVTQLNNQAGFSGIYQGRK